MRHSGHSQILLIVCLASLVVVSASHSHGLILVEDGVPQSVIVTNGKPGECQILAASELQEHLRIMSGAEIPIFKENELDEKARGGALILVGSSNLSRKHGFIPKGLPPETFVIKTVGNVLILAGEDGGGGKNRRQGTLWATYDFLQDQLGCRWIWPGDIGRVVPRQRTVSVGELDVRETPLLQKRHIRAANQEKHRKMYLENGIGEVLDLGPAYAQLAEDEAVWLRRMRMGSSGKLTYGHAFTDWWEKYGESQPEIFAQQPNGTRGPRRKKKPDFVKMCVSNPRLWDIQLEPLRKAAAKGAKGLQLNASENDGSGGFCVCSRCRTWDSDANTSLASMPPVEDGSDVDGGGDASTLPDCLSDRYARWYNELAARLTQFDPDGRVIAYAYSRYRSPPPTIDRIHPAVLVGYVGFNSYPRTQEYMAMSQAEWQGWSSKGATVFLRSNSLFYAGEGVPFVFTNQLIDDFRFQIDNGLRATDFDCLQGLWAMNGPAYYVLARMLWDTDVEKDDILGEYYGTFGPLAPVVRDYMEYWENFTEGLADHPEFRDRNRTERLLAYPRVYTADVLSEALSILRKARPVFSEATKEEQGRFRNIMYGLEHGKLLVAALASGKTGSGEAAEKLIAFRRKIASRNVLNIYWSTYKEIRYRVYSGI